MASRSLPQFMQHQTQTNWCWAANGASVGNFYWGAGTYTQCGIANACQGSTTCCSNPGPCNQYGYLDKALTAAKSYCGMQSGTISYADVSAQINMSRPVGTRVAWRTGGAHFMMISGYNDAGQTITVQDPWYGTSTIAFSSYAGSYQGGGTWTHTYFTCKQGAKPGAGGGADMSITFAPGGPTDVHRKLGPWVDIVHPDDLGAAGGAAEISDTYRVDYLSLEEVAAGNLLDAAHHSSWRTLVTHGGRPHGELEIAADSEEPVAYHQGRGAGGFVQALGIARSGLEGAFEATVLQSAPLHFVGLWLHNDDEDWVIPYEPNLTRLENYTPVPAEKAAKVLRRQAREILKADAGSEPTAG